MPVDAPLKFAGRAAPAAGRTAHAMLRDAGFALLLLLPLLWGLGQAPLFDVDEGAFAEATREMLAGGDYLHTTLNGEPRFDKPIGVYWLQAASVASFGLNEFALRLPSALSIWAMALALCVFIAPRYGRRTAMFSGLLLVSSIGMVAIARAATADALLNLLLALAGLDLWRFLGSGEDRNALRRTYLWVGLGLLVKGPVVVLVPGAAGLLWCATGRQWQRMRIALTDWRAWTILLAVAVPWYAYAWNRHGMDFVNGFIMKHNLGRYGSTMESHGGGLLYYVAIVPLLVLPWTPLLAAVLGRLRTGWRTDPLFRYLAGWAGFVFVFFTFSATKLPHYVLYGSAPAVLLCAHSAAAADTRMQRWLLATYVLAVTLLLALPLVLVGYADALSHPVFGPLARAAAVPHGMLAGGLLLLALTIASHGLRAGFPARYGTLLLLFALWFVHAIVPWWADVLQGPVKAAGLKARQLGKAAVQWKLHRPSLAVYQQAPAPRRAPQPGELALVALGKAPGLAGFDILSERGGIALVRRRRTPDDPVLASGSGTPTP